MTMVKVTAVIGRETHSTSSGWGHLTLNGVRLSHRDAISKQWLTPYGDRHASWCEAVFQVPEGAFIEWDAGANSGSRGQHRRRQHLILRVDSSAPVWESENLGYPCRASLRGRLRVVRDLVAERKAKHEALKEE